MPSKLSIINNTIALYGIDEPLMEDLYSNTMTSSQQSLLQRYDFFKADFLTQYNWRFALKRDPLNKDPIANDNKYYHRYNVPPDLLKLFQVFPYGWDRGNHYPEFIFDIPSYQNLWEMRDNHIYTLLSNPWIEYIYNVPEENIPADVAMAFSYYMLMFIKRLDPDSISIAELKINKALTNDINTSNVKRNPWRYNNFF